MISSALFTGLSSIARGKAASATERIRRHGHSGRWWSRKRGEIRRPPMRRSDGRQWEDSVAAHGEDPMAAVTGLVLESSEVLRVLPGRKSRAHL